MNEFEEKIIFETIKSELKRFKNDDLYRCPVCEKNIKWNDVNYNPEEATYTCPKCKNAYAENELQALSVYDLIEEMFIAFEEKNNETDFE